jgi:hypothetical protein
LDWTHIGSGGFQIWSIGPVCDISWLFCIMLFDQGWRMDEPERLSHDWYRLWLYHHRRFDLTDAIDLSATFELISRSWPVSTAHSQLCHSQYLRRRQLLGWNDSNRVWLPHLRQRFYTWYKDSIRKLIEASAANAWYSIRTSSMDRSLLNLAWWRRSTSLTSVSIRIIGIHCSLGHS